MDVLVLAMKTRNREGFLAALTVFRMTLHSLSHPRLADRGAPAAHPGLHNTEDWGRPADLHNLDVKWYELYFNFILEDAESWNLVRLQSFIVKK